MQNDVFGKTPSGETVMSFRLELPSGAYLNVLTLGCIIQALGMPDRDGKIADVVLGFERLEEYLAPHPYFGAIAGRVAGRIPSGKLFIDDRLYQLALNNGPNHLHGGLRGLDKRIWHAQPGTGADGSESIRLTYTSPDGEEGYPGTVRFAVTYTLTPGHVVIVETEAVSDVRTPANLTQHSYFHLAGEGSGDIADHTLSVFAEHTHAMDEKMTPLGRLESVHGRASDLNIPRRLGDAIPHWFHEHGDLYQLPQVLCEAARLEHPGSGRVLSVFTDESCLQVYTGNSLDGSLKGKSGRPYERFAGLCLECEGFPCGVDQIAFGSIFLEPSVPRRRTTRYAFSTR